MDLNRNYGRESLAEFYKLLGEEGCKRIEAIGVPFGPDEHKPYIAATRRYCSHASIVYDEFHVLNNYGKVIDKVANTFFYLTGKTLIMRKEYVWEKFLR